MSQLQLKVHSVDSGNGATTPATLRVTLASDSPGVGGGGTTAPTVVNAQQITNATGTTFNVLAGVACTAVVLFNTTGTTIEVQRGGAGVALKVPDGVSKTFDGITNANQLGIRRTDTSNTTVTVQYEVRS